MFGARAGLGRYAGREQLDSKCRLLSMLFALMIPWVRTDVVHATLFLVDVTAQDR